MARSGFGRTDSLGLLPLEGLQGAAARFGRVPAAVHLLHGHSSVYTAALLLGCASKGPVAVVDGAMRFNSYRVSRLASFLGMSPAAVLGRTHVTRAFTAFQTEAALTEKLPAFLARTPSCRLAVVLGLLDTYYDEQVKPPECSSSLKRVMDALAALSRSGGTHILIADVDVGENAPAGKKALFSLIRREAGTVVLLSHDGSRFMLNPGARHGTQ